MFHRWGLFVPTITTKKGMYLVFQVIDNKTRIHVFDIRIAIKRTRQAKVRQVNERDIERAKQEAEKRLFLGMASKVAREMNTTTDDVIRATEKEMLFVCVPYSVEYVGMTEK